MPAKTRAGHDRLRPAGGEFMTCAELPAWAEVPGCPVRAEGRVGWARPPEACAQLERAAASASSTHTGIALLEVTVSFSWPSPVKAPQPRGISRGLPSALVPPAAHVAAAPAEVPDTAHQPADHSEDQQEDGQLARPREHPQLQVEYQQPGDHR